MPLPTKKNIKKGKKIYKLTETHISFLTASPQKGLFFSFVWHVHLTWVNTVTWGAEKGSPDETAIPSLQTILQELQPSTPTAANTVRAFSNCTHSVSTKQH